ncbi:kinase-like domain-containing protein [Podospora fimiseda]|uniref:Kinase-like domain-containing protein n=1 Tax=Podospora fimiseda TaxID=252190 RepID=A0AAN7BGH4_9PEZI|nr:kinase-like domain-containing protein [Podospora fimiseda]
MEDGEELGRGGFGTVWLQRCRKGPKEGQLRAVKSIRCSGGAVSPSSECVRELEAIDKFSQLPYHHCFVQSFGWYETSDTVFVVMEYFEHGDLQQFLGSLQFMHHHRFAHRDLKPQNILVQTLGPRRTSVGAGTPGYMAPEAQGIFTPGDMSISRSERAAYIYAVDIWAVGIIALRMVSNAGAFDSSEDFFTYVVAGRPFCLPETTNSASPEFKDFVHRPLAPSAPQRITAEAALQHTWVLSRTSDTIESDTDSESIAAGNSIS